MVEKNSMVIDRREVPRNVSFWLIRRLEVMLEIYRAITRAIVSIIYNRRVIYGDNDVSSCFEELFSSLAEAWLSFPPIYSDSTFLK